MKRYTLYCDSELVESSDNLDYLVNLYAELDGDTQDMLIMDNNFDEPIYG